jgi:polysaccharide biosynthesis transport protein
MKNGFQNLNQILVALAARWKLMAAMAVAVPLVVLAALLILEPKYQSTATVIFDTRGSDPTAQKTDNQSMSSLVAGEIDLMRSRRIVDQLGKDPAILADPVIQKHWQENRKGKAKMGVWLANYVKPLVSVSTNSRQSRAIDITVQEGNPAFAQLIANGLAKAYLDTNLELRVSPARQNVEWLAKQKALRFADFRATQKELEAFLRKTGMTGSEIDASVSELKLRSLSSELAKAQVDRAKAVSVIEALGPEAAISTGQISSPTVQSLRTQIAEQNVLIQELSSKYGPNHPTMMAGHRRLESLRTELDREIGKAAQTLRQQGASTIGEERRVQAMTDDQRRSISVGAGKRSELSILSANVVRAKRAYDVVAEALTQLQLASSLEQPNARILTQAQLPQKPSFPNWGFSLALAALAGILLGVVLALAMELIRQPVRLRSDLERLFPGVPILSEMPSLRQAGA